MEKRQGDWRSGGGEGFDGHPQDMGHRIGPDRISPADYPVTKRTSTVTSGRRFTVTLPA